MRYKLVLQDYTTYSRKTHVYSDKVKLKIIPGSCYSTDQVLLVWTMDANSSPARLSVARPLGLPFLGFGSPVLWHPGHRFGA